VLSPVFAWVTRGRYYIARADTLPEPLVVDGQLSTVLLECAVCATEFERPDMASCPFHHGAVCSLCCSLDKQCHDMCKTTTRGGNGTRKVDVSITPMPG
jgi:hypothetical protein